MNKQQLEQLIKEELQNILNEEDAYGAKMAEGTLQMTDSGQRIYDEAAPALKDVVKAIFASHGVDDISIEAVADALKDVAKMVEKY